MARCHWTAAQLYDLISSEGYVQGGQVQFRKAAVAMAKRHPERLRPRVAAAVEGMRLLDAHAFGLLYLHNPEGAQRDGEQLHAACAEPMVDDVEEVTNLQEAADGDSSGSESSELSPSSTPDGIRAAQALAMEQDSARARHACGLQPEDVGVQGRRWLGRTPKRPRAKATALEQGLKVPDELATVPAAPKAKNPSQVAKAKAKSTAKAKAKGAAKSRGKGAAAAKPANARGARAARETRDSAHGSWAEFLAAHRADFGHLPPKKVSGAVAALWREHQAKALGKPYGCPKCRYLTGCPKCNRYPPGKGPRAAKAELPVLTAA